MADHEAYLLRENTRSSGLMETVGAAATTLAHWDIPHLIAGGVAVQEHGYPRLTLGIDMIVPDVLEAVELLTADLGGPFVRMTGCQDRVEDERNGVKIDLLPAGAVLKQGCKVPFPEPAQVTDRPQIVSVEMLISLKLDSWLNSPAKRLKDKADVTELILRRKLSRDLRVAPAIREVYEQTWDALQTEK